MLLNFDFLFLILFSFLSLVFFSNIRFFFLFFLLHTRTPNPNIYLHSLFDFLFFYLSRKQFSPSPSLFRSLSLTHTQISLPQSHTNKFSFIHAQITGREQRLESSPLLRTCSLITILVRSTFYMVFFFCSGLISFILLFRFHQAYEKDCFCVSNLLIGLLF